jgi:hypothetical protein
MLEISERGPIVQLETGGTTKEHRKIRMTNPCNPPLHILANSHVRLALSEHGTLDELTCLATGRNHVVRPGMDLWRIVLADEESLVNLVTPGNQPVKVSKDGDALCISVPQLAYDFHGTTREVDVAFHLTVSLDADTTLWQAAIENRDPAIRVMEVWAPMINGIRPPADWALYYPQDCGLRMFDPVQNLGTRGQMLRFGVNNANLRELYPGKASMQWMGLYGEEEGLYACSLDTSMQTICLNVERNFGQTAAEDSLFLSFIKYPGQRVGSWTSAPVAVSPHLGDWHAGARRYRAWTDTWITPATPPDWIQRMPGLQDVILREQYGKLVYGYEEITKLYDAAAEVGIDLVKISGWHTAGHDNAFPDWEADTAQGGRETLIAEMRKAQEKGARMMLYLSHNSTFFAEHGEAVAMRDPYGEELADIFNWPGPSTFIPLCSQHRLVCACMSTKEWQDIIKYRTQYVLDLGADCVYLDRLAGYPGYLCFSEDHPHDRPCDAYVDRVSLGMECRAMVKAKNPEIAIASEYINDVGLQPFDFTIPFGFGMHRGGNNFGELFRYTFPEYIITTQYLNDAEYDRVRFAFVMGFRFFFAIKWQHEPISSTPPEFRAFAKSLIDLLQAHAEPFLLGRFCDTDGFNCANPALFAKAYRSDKRFGIAVWNPTGEAQALVIATDDDMHLQWIGPDGPLGNSIPANGVALAVTARD